MGGRRRGDAFDEGGGRPGPVVLLPELRLEKDEKRTAIGYTADELNAPSSDPEAYSDCYIQSAVAEATSPSASIVDIFQRDTKV